MAIAGSRRETVEKALVQLPKYKERVMGIWPDLCSPEEAAAALASVQARFGSLDILVNNAGISSRTGLYDYTLDEFSKIVDVNLTAVFVCSQAAARLMKKQGGGAIINASSMAGEYGQPSGCGYPLRNLPGKPHGGARCADIFTRGKSFRWISPVRCASTRRPTLKKSSSEQNPA